MAETIKTRGGKVGHGCSPGCVIRCSQIYHDKEGKVLTGGFEYESVWSMGANLGINNLDDVALMNRLCDDYGLDTIDTGVALGVLDGSRPFHARRQQSGDFPDPRSGAGDAVGMTAGAGAAVTGKASARAACLCWWAGHSPMIRAR